MARVAGRFARAEPRATAGQFVEGLLSGLERKTCWSLAERAGHADPQAMQRLLRTAVWDADAVRDDVRAWLVERLGHPDGVLVVDETGFLKKGGCSVGVQRQYTGTAGRVENAQVGVFLAYVTGHGRAMIDRRLYLPQTTWCQQPQRLVAAGVPDEVGFATKPALARQMIAAALDADVPVGWVTGDEVYGADPGLRADLEHRRIGYVLAVGCDRRVHVNDGRTLIRVDDLADGIPTTSWQPHSCGPGAKGPRDYLWAWITTATTPGEHRWLLIRRNHTTAELAYYLCWSPRPAPLHTLVRAAGSRWSIEELFQTGKGQVGLDHYQVRGWTGWQRFVTLAMLALAVLTILAAQQPCPEPETIALTVAEIRRLLNTFVLAIPLLPAHTLHWSIWRRTSQARARRSHYQRRLAHHISPKIK
ncbi:IS701 family transposase [Micromonospora sp. NBC_01655]|uniref:IS701 family transposase n=1 Tax=Micromonospora sp. NBC_01655 TaxID=2975983 RepID=UPI002251C455|nr:IS701 family transposase [Micromonospora sp. NBC_01655]MCX4471328.1 IS701 family transposase [Micromonospora sp. NBC_01655]MCX4472373.1 IS701 family transposase [Micromonospora sp. NBC_01655]MCX4473038.1 IS701 family transposase [Micromonospora sp. NBC_01655]MCX4473349.1 IS701 family transposase [Micromonospora sp. NBC_01655]